MPVWGTRANLPGDKLSIKGIKPDPEKIRAINEMPDPSNKADVQRRLGLVNQGDLFGICWQKQSH